MKSLFGNSLPLDLKEALDTKYKALKCITSDNDMRMHLKDVIGDYCMRNGMGFLEAQRYRKEWLDEYESNNTT